MLEDLGTGTTGGGHTVTHTQHVSTSSSHQMSYSSQQGMRTQTQSQSSQASQRTMFSGSSNTNSNYALTRGPSGADLADGVLRDLEDGLVKSTSYIQDKHNKHTGPHGTQDWDQDTRGTQLGEFNLEQQVQHMIPQSMQSKHQNFSAQQNNLSQHHMSGVQQQQQQQQQTYNQIYKVQSNQYSITGERINSPIQPGEEEERPGSRLKQNIDELDTLLYDLNNARKLSPDMTGPQSGNNKAVVTPLDSDDYDETVGTTGHVKRTVTAFNEFTQQTGQGKPPSPSPRRKPSPAGVRKTPPTSPNRINQNTTTSSSSYNQHQQSTNSQYQYSQDRTDDRPICPPYLPEQGPPGSNQPFSYSDSPDPVCPSSSPDQFHPRQSSKYEQVTSPVQAFPSASARPPTPQMPPKRVEELMSEFSDFDWTQGGSVSPTHASFSRAAPAPKHEGHITVTELEDQVGSGSPSPRHTVSSPPGPQVYYPPGAEFTQGGHTSDTTPVQVTSQEIHTSQHGDMEPKERKGKREADRERQGRRDRGEQGADKQGAAVIPICLPLCCAAPCVIM